jgi:hypothetical protein
MIAGNKRSIFDMKESKAYANVDFLNRTALSFPDRSAFR